jgi:hypothetical protein
MATMYDSDENWCYKLTGGAIDNFIRQIEGEEALKTCLEFCDRCNRAEPLMFYFFGLTPCLYKLAK